MRLVFLGTPQFAVPSLESLASAGHEIDAVFTQPDRPKGRGNQLNQSPVKDAASKLGLTIHQPERIRRPDSVELLRSMRPELMVVVGYGQIIPQAIIDIPRHGILNVHASLLPKYRGAAPIQWALAHGEVVTGVTIMEIDAGLDTGDMLEKAELKIGSTETAPELSERLASLGANLLISVINRIRDGTLRREKQNDADATLAPILKKEDGLIVWTRIANEIFNRQRGFTPWPGAYSTLRGETLSILRAAPVEYAQSLSPGAVLVEGRRLLVGCGQNSTLELFEVQLQSKKRLPIENFLNGYRLSSGEILGEPI